MRSASTRQLWFFSQSYIQLSDCSHIFTNKPPSRNSHVFWKQCQVKAVLLSIDANVGHIQTIRDRFTLRAESVILVSCRGMYLFEQAYPSYSQRFGRNKPRVRLKGNVFQKEPRKRGTTGTQDHLAHIFLGVLRDHVVLPRPADFQWLLWNTTYWPRLSVHVRTFTFIRFVDNLQKQLFLSLLVPFSVVTTKAGLTYWHTLVPLSVPVTSPKMTRN